MMCLETWRRIFRTAALKLELADVDLDDNGNCTIVSDEAAIPSINIAFDEESGKIDIFSELGVVPESDPNVYRELLFDNLFGEKTKGAVYAASPATGHIVLQRTFAVETDEDDGDTFASVLAAFVETAYNGRRLIYRSLLGGEDVPARKDTTLDLFMRV